MVGNEGHPHLLMNKESINYKNRILMKRTLIAMAVLLVASCLGLSAQDKDNAKSYDEFSGHWLIGVQGGIGQTLGETRFGTLISPAASVWFGYQFTPVWGLRAGLSGWQAKGAVVDGSTSVYRYNYLQGNVDVLVDLCGIAGYRVSRAVNPYLFAGIGVNGAFNNGEAQELGPRLPEDNLLWDGSKVLPAGRFGVGMGVRITDAVHFNIEVNANVLGDAFNSKRGSAVDWQLGALAGFTFKIGLKKEKAAEEVPVVEPAPAAEPAPEPEPEPAAEPEPAPVASATAVAAAGQSLEGAEYAAPAFEAVEENVFFLIGQSSIRESEASKVDAVADVLRANPQTRVTVTGHADRETGSAERNMELSRERAENVAAALIAAGIEADRITVLYRGAEETPFDTPEENRVAICVVDDAE